MHFILNEIKLLIFGFYTRLTKHQTRCIKNGKIMSKLSKEITENNAEVKLSPHEKNTRKELVESMLNSVSGGWVNVFARWDKQI